jgi:hypothetical protein
MLWHELDQLMNRVQDRASLPILVHDALDRTGEGLIAGAAAIVANRFLEPNRAGVSLGDVIDLIQTGPAPDDPMIGPAFASDVPAVVAARAMQAKDANVGVVLLSSGPTLISGERLREVVDGLERLFVEALLPPALESYALATGRSAPSFPLEVLRGAFGLAVTSAASLAVCYACDGQPVHTYLSARSATQCSYPATFLHQNPKVTAVASTRC